MKRVLTILAILLLPLSVWAMTPVTDSDLSNVTGQAGVNINADLTMNINIGTMAWGDADGIAGPVNPWGTGSAGGYVGVNNFNISNLRIRARYETADHFNSYSTLFLKPITIDVATGGSDGHGAGVTFVRFGIGALKISMNSLQFDVSLGDRTLDAYGNVVLDQNMGRVSLAAMDIYMNPWSYVDIFAHGGSGVTFDVNVTIDRFAMNSMSWGDTDGFAGAANPLPAGGTTGGNWFNTTSAAGYVGLNNFVMGNAYSPAITITGQVAIDVVTSAHGIYADLEYLHSQLPHATSHIAGLLILNSIQTALGSAIPAGTPMANIITAVGSVVPGVSYANVTPKTIVHISFPENFTITIARMTGDVALGNNAYFTGAGSYTQTLGDIYIQGMTMQIGSGSWVDIWAH